MGETAESKTAEKTPETEEKAVEETAETEGMTTDADEDSAAVERQICLQFTQGKI